MKRRRFRALGIAFVLLTAACGGGDDVSDADRVIASPLASPSVSPVDTQSPKPKATSGERSDETPGASGTSSSARTTEPRPATSQPARPASLAKARIKLTKIATLADPVAFAVRKGDSDFYIAERHSGKIRTIRNGRVGATVLDIGGEISTGNEQGLLGLAFSPSASLLYINFTNQAGDTVIREYSFSSGRTSSPRTVLTVDQPFANHNGGNLVFGPDGFLYIGLGDGGSAGDPMNNAQNLETLLGKMLRINPAQSGSSAYTSPSSNPFVGRDGRDEIWAYGLRNPWRYSFDRSTKDLFIGDVGQGEWEEISFQPGAATGGDNYGWRHMEGSHSYGGGTPPSGHHGPIYEYSHDGGNCSVTGGYVYRGSRIHDLKGAYVFADFCVGDLRAFTQKSGRASGQRLLGKKVGSLSSFGQDAKGELYVLSLGGEVYRIDPA